MKALTFDRFGGIDQLRFTDQPDPVAGKNQVVVAIAARSVNIIDIRVRNGMIGPLVNKKFPKIPGCDLAGTVIQVGPGVTDLSIGDNVFGATAPFKGGSFAERVAVSATQIAPLPPDIDARHAAALPIAGLAALYALRDLGKLQAGQRVLIHGATGAVGLYAVQLAKLLRATVTAVAGAGLQAAADLGADTLIDYRTQVSDPFRQPFDVILNASGKMTWAVGRKYLTPAGRLIEPSPTIPLFIGAMAANTIRRQKHLPLATAPKRPDLAYLAGLVTDGKLKPTIAATLPFDRAKEAFVLVESGGVVGKVVVTA